MLLHPADTKKRESPKVRMSSLRGRNATAAVVSREPGHGGRNVELECHEKQRQAILSTPFDQAMRLRPQRAQKHGRHPLDDAVGRVSLKRHDRLLPELDVARRPYEGPRPADLFRRVPDDRVELRQTLRQVGEPLDVVWLDGGDVLLCERKQLQLNSPRAC